MVLQYEEITKALNFKKHSALISMKNDITSIQRKLFNTIFYLASKQPKKENAGIEYEIRWTEIVELSGLTEYTNMKYLKEALRELMNIVIECNILQKDKRKRSIMFVLLQVVQILQNDEYIRVTFSVPVYEQLHNPDMYALLNLGIVNQLASKHSIALYELFTDYKNIQKYTIEIALLKHLLGVSNDDYERFESFRRKVIEPAVKEINEKTDLTIKYELNKTANTYTSITFYITSKQTKELTTEIQSSVYTLLKNYGVSESNCIKFAKEISAQNVKHSIELLEKTIKTKTIKNKSAYLTTMLKNNVYSTETQPPTPPTTTDKPLSDIALTDKKSYSEYYNERLNLIVSTATDEVIDEFLTSQIQFYLNHLKANKIINTRYRVIDKPRLLKEFQFIAYIEKKFLSDEIEQKMFYSSL